MAEPDPLPIADGLTGLEVLKGLARDRSLLTALTLMRKHVGKVFKITLPRFKPAVVVGPESNRQILVSQRNKFLWRSEVDPVTRLLRRGVLVVDGAEHDELRKQMDPLLQRRHVLPQIQPFWDLTGQVTQTWQDEEQRDMLVEMRKAALLILYATVFKVDLSSEIDRLWSPILTLLKHISPGLWIIFPKRKPGRKVRQAIEIMDEHLYRMIQDRRQAIAEQPEWAESPDLLTRLIQTEGMEDGLIRDQLLTMLIAGHDTSTALLAWTLYLLGMHPEVMERARTEVDEVLEGTNGTLDIDRVGRLDYLGLVIKEVLRLYPPIHVGNRLADEDLELCGYRIPAGTRVMYSIYLSHRDPDHWLEPEKFNPDRFSHEAEVERPAFTYVPFGGGPRNCIGAAFAQVESKVVLARLLYEWDLELLNGNQIHPYMGATLEPRPGVLMRVRRRR